MNFYEVPWGKVRVWCGLKHMFFVTMGFPHLFVCLPPGNSELPWRLPPIQGAENLPRLRFILFPSGTLSFWDSLFHPLYNIYTVYMIRIKDNNICCIFMYLLFHSFIYCICLSCNEWTIGGLLGSTKQVSWQSCIADRPSFEAATYVHVGPFSEGNMLSPCHVYCLTRPRSSQTPGRLLSKGLKLVGIPGQEYIHSKLIQTVQMYRLHNSRFWINRDISASCINISQLYLPIYPGCGVKHAGMAPAAVPPSCRARATRFHRALSGARPRA